MRRNFVAVFILVLVAAFSFGQVSLDFGLTDALVDPGGSAILSGRLTYSGAENANIKIKLVKSAPPGWDIGACTETYCFSESTTIPMEPGDRENLSIEVYPSSSANGLAKVIMSANIAGLPDTVSVEFRFAIDADWLLVNGGTNSNARYFIESARDIDLHFVCVQETFVTTTRALRFRNIIWFSGDEQDVPINEDEMGIILISANSGIPVGLIGQNIVEGWGPNPPEYITSVFGCKYSSEGTLFINDECDGISFSILGGDGANNQTTPDALIALGDAEVCFRYDDGTIAGVRNEGSDTRTCVLGFGIEAISDGETRTEVLSNIVLWLSNSTVSEYVQSNNSGIFAFPNPFNSVCEIHSSTPDVRIFDIYGKLIEIIKINDGKALWNPQNLSSGIYFVEVNKIRQKLVYLR